MEIMNPNRMVVAVVALLFLNDPSVPCAAGELDRRQKRMSRQRLQVGSSKEETRRIVGEPDNYDDEYIWIWLENKPVSKVSWYDLVTTTSRRNRFLYSVFDERGRVILPETYLEKEDPWNAVRRLWSGTSETLSIDEAERILGYKHPGATVRGYAIQRDLKYGVMSPNRKMAVGKRSVTSGETEYSLVDCDSSSSLGTLCSTSATDSSMTVIWNPGSSRLALIESFPHDLRLRLYGMGHRDIISSETMSFSNSGTSDIIKAHFPVPHFYEVTDTRLAWAQWISEDTLWMQVTYDVVPTRIGFLGLSVHYEIAMPGERDRRVRVLRVSEK